MDLSIDCWWFLNAQCVVRRVFLCASTGVLLRARTRNYSVFRYAGRDNIESVQFSANSSYVPSPLICSNELPSCE